MALSNDPQARVARLLDKMPLLDGHNDLALVIRRHPEAQGDIGRFGLDRETGYGDTDIPRLRAGRVSAQVFAAFVPSESQSPTIETMEQLDVIMRMQDAFPDVFHPILQSSDIRAAKEAGRIGSMLAIEGGVGLADSLAPLRVWYAAGVRLMTLCHNGSLPWVDSATDSSISGGLSAFGEAVIREMNRLGMIVDCAHVADDAIRCVLDISAAPIVASHNNVRTMCSHQRNLPDDIIDRIAQGGGIVMATFIPKFISNDVRTWIDVVRKHVGAGTTLPHDWAEQVRNYERQFGKGPTATLSQVADHIDYIADRVGRDHVGIGSDFWGGPDTPDGLNDASCFPALLEELARRNWSDTELEGVAAANFIRVFAAVEEKSRELRGVRATELAFSSLGSSALS